MRYLNQLCAFLALILLVSPAAAIDPTAIQARGLASQAQSNAQTKADPIVNDQFCMIGDSITAGSVATLVQFQYTSVVQRLLGSAFYKAPIVSGHAGFRAFEIQPFLIPDVMNSGCTVVLIEAGTNDAALGTSFASYTATMLQMFKTVKQGGKRLMVATVPPHGITFTADVHRRNEAYNIWLRQTVPHYGTLVDFFHLMYLPTNGGVINAALAADQTHPNNKGHLLFGREIVKQYKLGPATSPYLIDGTYSPAANGINILANPYFLTDTAGWTTQGGGTGTTSWTRVADSSGFTYTGSTISLDAGLSSVADSFSTETTSVATTFGTMWFAGDVMAFTAKMQVIDVSGDWETNCLNNISTGGASYGNVTIYDVTHSVAIADAQFNTCGVQVSAGVYNVGPAWVTFTVPAGTTSMQMWLTGKAQTGLTVHYKFNFSELGLFDLTQQGMVNAPTRF